MYDTDATTFSPEGRLYQVQYATEAVQQGSACVGMVSKDHAVLVALKRTPSELAEYQKKVFRIDNHIGIAISGLTADARSLYRWMRTESLNHKFVFGSSMQTGRLVGALADKHQECTQSYVRRPYGVGLLIAGYDKSTGPHLYQTDPAGNYFEWKSMAIGARSQTAKTYLEKHFESFPECSLDEMVQHGLRALNGCTEAEKELTAESVTVAYVGKDTKFTVVDGVKVAPYLQTLHESLAANEGAAAEGKAADEEGDVDLAADGKDSDGGDVDI